MLQTSNASSSSSSAARQPYRNEIMQKFAEDHGNPEIRINDRELMEKMRDFLEATYHKDEVDKQRKLVQLERKRIRKMIMEGTCTDEELEFYRQGLAAAGGAHTASSSPRKEDFLNSFRSEFNPNPSHTGRWVFQLDESDGEQDGGEENANQSEEQQKEGDEAADANQNEDEEKAAGDENSEEKNDEIDHDNCGFHRQKSELTLALESEETVAGLYEIASKMVYVSNVSAKK